ncbi:MAG: hypothetical protein NVS2B7_02570 [Herpetosiphon sp.]
MQHSGQPGQHAARWLRYLLITCLALDLLLIAGRVLTYPPLLIQQNALGYVLAPVALLLFYGALAFVMTRNPTPQQRVAHAIGITTGFITGALWLINLALETFAHSSGILSTAPFLLGAFALWGAAGFWCARRTGSLRCGILAAVCSAMICVLLTTTFGFALTFTALPRLEHSLVADPDFLRSNWSDLRAFAIANTFDAGFSHLLGALLISTVVGSLAGGLARLHISAD